VTSAIRVHSRDAATPVGPARTRDKVIYWVFTSLVSAVMLFSVVNFTFNDHFPAWDPNGPSAFTHLGLPPWFKVELTIAKVLGLLALWVPGVPRTLKEFAYAGFGITLVSATVAHAASGDFRLSPLFVVDPPIFLGMLVASYLYARKVGR
jgi:hypothetical protein